MDEITVLTALASRHAHASEVISCLINLLPEVSHIRLFRLEVAPLPKLDEKDRAAVDALSPPALQLRNNYGVPFWTALMLTAAHTGDPLPEGVLRSALYHQDTAAVSVAEDLAVEKVSPEELEKRAEMLSSSSVLALASQVILHSGERAHLPMLDFRLRPGPANLSSAIQAIEQLGVSGVILDSGNSYHFYGRELLDDAELGLFLAKALLFAPLVDHRWIAHQLIERSCLLRVSHGVKGQQTPKAVAVVNV